MFTQEKLYEPYPEPDAYWRARWPNFQPGEFACNCNGRFCNHSYYHDPDLLTKLQMLRRQNGALFINSGHRCETWNRLEGGASKSRHLGLAVDIRLHNHDRFKLRESAEVIGFTGFGLGLNFLHLDCRPELTVWDYDKASRLAWNR